MRLAGIAPAPALGPVLLGSLLDSARRAAVAVRLVAVVVFFWIPLGWAAFETRPGFAIAFFAPATSTLVTLLTSPSAFRLPPTVRVVVAAVVVEVVVFLVCMVFAGMDSSSTWRVAALALVIRVVAAVLFSSFSFASERGFLVRCRVGVVLVQTTKVWTANCINERQCHTAQENLQDSAFLPDPMLVQELM